MSDITSPNRWLLALPGLVLVALHGLAMLFPDQLWGLHTLYCLPAGLGAGIFVATLLLALLPLLPGELPILRGTGGKAPSWQKWLLLILAPAFFGILFTQLPIAGLVYGDSAFVFPQVNAKMDAWDGAVLKHAFLLDPTNLKTGMDTFYAWSSLLGYVLDIKASQAVILLETMLGMWFVLVWLLLVRQLFQRAAGRWLFGIMGLSAPILQVYFGHYETYAFSIAANLTFLATLVMVFRTREKKWFWCMVAALYFALKFHFTGYIMVPAAIFAGVYTFRKAETSGPSVIHWRRALVQVLAPIAALGSLAYFFVTRNAFGPRSYTSDTLETVVFLPLVAEEPAPLDRYNLLSGAHFWDFGNMLVLLSAGALMMLGVALLMRRSTIRWQSPLVVTLGMTLTLYLTAFFVLNPLLSMAQDQDLMSIPGPALLMFTAVIWADVADAGLFRKLLGPMAAFALITACIFYTNAEPAALSYHSESMGKHSFRTYWIGASTSISMGLDMEADSLLRETRSLEMLAALEPAATLGNDIEYSQLLLNMGEYYEARDQNTTRARPYYEQALKWAPYYGKALYKLTILSFLQGNFQEACQYLPGLVKADYPNRKKALRIAIHVSLEAAQYQEAANYAVTYLKYWPDDTTIQTVRDRLATGDAIDQIKLLFRSGS